MARTTVVNCRTKKYDIYVGRPSLFENPYKIGIDGTRAEVIEKYRQYLLSSPDLMARLPELRDKRLGCWCKPLPCHGDILAELADKHGS